MEKLDSSLEILQKELVNVWGEYVKLFDELNLFRGEIIGDNVDEVNRIISDIQHTYRKLHPTLIFIIKRNKDCVDLLSKYDTFINDIKNAGAQEVKEIVS